IRHGNDLLVIASCVKRGFVDDIRQIGTSETRSSASDNTYINSFIERYLSRVDLKNSFTTANIRTTHNYTSIKAARAEQRRIENVGPVGRSHQDHAVIRFKT